MAGFLLEMFPELLPFPQEMCTFAIQRKIIEKFKKKTMIRKSLFVGILLMAAVTVQAQLHLPPAFGGDTVNVRQDKLTRVYITPKKVLWKSNAISVKDEHFLLRPNTGQADLGTKDMCAMLTTGNDTASIILDYGRELHGGLKLVMGTSSKAGTSVVRIRFGESVMETCCENAMPSKVGYGTNDHAVRDIVMEIPQMGQIEIGSSGFRFVRIDLLSKDITTYLKEVTAIFRYRNIPYLGSFKCNDQRLNDIWMTGAYTVHLNMQEYIWDGIKRDRLVWLGDMHPETSTISCVFGDEESYYKSLDLACEQWPLPNWLNGMSAYSMWYLIIQYDWYMHNGNMAFLQKHKNYILGLIDLINSHVHEDGTEDLSSSRFLDWPSSPNEKGVESGYRALLCWAMNDGNKLCQLLGDPARAQTCLDIVKRLKKKILDPNNLKQAAALMAISDLMDAKKACKKYICVGGAKGFSTFYGYYMLQALAKAGLYDEALNIISEFWGGMLDLGATSFWENFDMDWMPDAAPIDNFVPAGKKDIHGDFGEYCYPGFRHSLCHGWASGPTAWMSQHVLGFEVLSPGCKKVRIVPHLGHLQWAEGSFPTPLGVIHVKHVKGNDGKVHSTINAPQGIEIVRK